MLKGSRGISSIGFLITIAILVAIGYAGYRFALVQWNVESFKEQMTELGRFFANERELNPGTIKADVIRRAAKCNIELDAENIFVNTDGADIIIQVTWTEPIVFPGGYTYYRNITVSRNVRKFGY